MIFKTKIGVWIMTQKRFDKISARVEKWEERRAEAYVRMTEYPDDTSKGFYSAAHHQLIDPRAARNLARALKIRVRELREWAKRDALRLARE
jgi:hypothetical protein